MAKTIYLVKKEPGKQKGKYRMDADERRRILSFYPFGGRKRKVFHSFDR
ncbi:hypothetical protein CL3_26030 [butyrate-producing bacterium SM4/1]|nr:hypothetical protein CL3_26030 [butyrate-producing bacterium SM4/1]